MTAIGVRIADQNGVAPRILGSYRRLRNRRLNGSRRNLGKRKRLARRLRLAGSKSYLARLRYRRLRRAGSYSDLPLRRAAQ